MQQLGAKRCKYLSTLRIGNWPFTKHGDMQKMCPLPCLVSCKRAELGCLFKIFLNISWLNFSRQKSAVTNSTFLPRECQWFFNFHEKNMHITLQRRKKKKPCVPSYREKTVQNCYCILLTPAEFYGWSQFKRMQSSACIPASTSSDMPLLCIDFINPSS